MITLQTFGPGMGMPDPSPFVMKAMMLLKLAGLEYREERADVRKAPKEKLPVLIDDGVKIPDSTFMRFHIEKKYGFDFDSGHSAAQKGHAWAIEKMLEDHLYWVMVHERWMIDTNFNKGDVHFFEQVPALIRPFVIRAVRKQQRVKLNAQGMGRHTRAEIIQLACRDIDAIADVLGDNTYLTGARPCGADAALFPFSWGILNPLFETPVRDYMQTKANLLAYVARMKSQYFPGF